MLSRLRKNPLHCRSREACPRKAGSGDQGAGMTKMGQKGLFMNPSILKKKKRGGEYAGGES